jgi:hypothetical protein
MTNYYALETLEQGAIWNIESVRPLHMMLVSDGTGHAMKKEMRAHLYCTIPIQHDL